MPRSGLEGLRWVSKSWYILMDPCWYLSIVQKQIPLQLGCLLYWPALFLWSNGSNISLTLTMSWALLWEHKALPRVKTLDNLFKVRNHQKPDWKSQCWAFTSSKPATYPHPQVDSSYPKPLFYVCSVCSSPAFNISSCSLQLLHAIFLLLHCSVQYSGFSLLISVPCR